MNENVQNEESQAADTNLEESPDEAIGDRIMEEMNGMKVYNCTKYVFNLQFVSL